MGEIAKSRNSEAPPRRYTTYERDGNQSDEAMHRRYNRWHLRFDQPDPYGGSYDLTDPQTFNRYTYTNNDPVNFTDPTGLLFQIADATTGWGSYSKGFWGAGNLIDRPRSLGRVGNRGGYLYVESQPGLLAIAEDDYRLSLEKVDGVWVPRYPHFTNVLAGWDWRWEGFFQNRRTRRLTPEQEQKLHEQYIRCSQHVFNDFVRDQGRLDPDPHKSPGQKAMDVLGLAGLFGGGLAALESGGGRVGNLLRVAGTVNPALRGSTYAFGIFKGGKLAVGSTYNIGRVVVRDIGCGMRNNSHPYYYHNPR